MFIRNNSIVLFLFICLFQLSGYAQQPAYIISKTAVLRNSPSINGDGLGMPLYGELVYLLNEYSAETASVRVNGKLLEGRWVKIETQSKGRAWVNEKQLSTTAPMPAYYASVNHLRVRTAGNLKAKVIAKLLETDVVTFTGRRSSKKQTLELRNKATAHYWLEVQTAANQRGWVYGGGLKPLERTGASKSISKTTVIKEKLPLYNEFGDKTSSSTIKKTPWSDIKVSAAEASILSAWWNGLSQGWQDYFSEVVLGKDIQALRSRPTLKELKYIKELKILKLDNDDACGSGPFYFAKITDLNGVRQLKKLEHLSCNYMKIKNLKPLMDLQNLTFLSLHHTHFESLSGIENLDNLKWLDISLGLGKKLDLEPLSQIRNLEKLYIEVDKLERFDNLRNSLKLKSLQVKIPDLRSLSGLDALYKLEHLSIQAEQSALDLRVLSNLKKLKYCTIEADDLQHVEVLAEARQLKQLVIGAPNSVFNANVLKNLSQLEELELQAKHISSIEALSRLSNLNALHIGKLDFFDFEIIQNCKKIKALEIDTKGFKNLNILEHFPKLSYLQIKSKAIKTISDLPTLPVLTHLHIESSQVKNLQGLGRFGKLYFVDVSNCLNLNDLKDIRLLDNLEYLYIPTTIPLDGAKIRAIDRPTLDIRYEAIGGC